MAVMTIRSDFLGQLQSATSLTARFEEFSLGPMPLSRIPQVIEGPARRTGLRVEDEFVQQAAHDAETEDALPLLAFTLRQLFDQSAKDQSKEGCLTLQAYKSLGDEAARLGPLENAVRKAADAVLDEANATDEEKTALREAFVPAMVRVNEQGEYVRCPARMDELPAKSKPLLERLAKARLLVIRQEGDTRVVEVAHEALLRKWPWLKERLDAERVFLIGKQQLEQDLRDWQAAADKDKAGALLTGLKLTRARAWLVDHPTRLTDDERAFIQASIEREEAEKRSRERRRTITNVVSIAAAIVFFLLAGMAWWQRYEAQSATREAQNALTGSFFRTIGVSSADIPTQDEREALWELAQLDPANAVVRENLLNRWFSTAESFMRGEARNGQGFRAAIGLNLKYRRITTRNAGEFGLRLASLLEKPREIQFSEWRKFWSIGKALETLKNELEPQAATKIAVVLAAALEDPQAAYSGPDRIGPDRLEELSIALAALADKMEPQAAPEIAKQGAQGLVVALKSLPEPSPYPLSDFGFALAALANKMEPHSAAEIAFTELFFVGIRRSGMDRRVQARSDGQK